MSFSLRKMLNNMKNKTNEKCENEKIIKEKTSTN